MSRESSRKLAESTFSYRSTNRGPAGISPRFTRKPRRSLALSRRRRASATRSGGGLRYRAQNSIR